MVQQKLRISYKSRPQWLLAGVVVAAVGAATVFVVHASSAYRAFTSSSYWNTPFEAGAPIDTNSGSYIADSENTANTQDYLKLTLGNYAEPIFFATSSDPLYTLTDGTNTIKVHIPNGAAPAAGTDGQMTIYDQASGYNNVVDLHGVVISNGQYSTNGIGAYSLNSNGLAGGAAGADDPSNFGHRGIPAAVRAVRKDEIDAGVINHRLECFWWATAPSHYWPMIGHENNKGGIVPEGIVVRIKPSVDLGSKSLSGAAKIIATALQKYGCIVGDNSGSGNRLKLQENTDWTGVLNANSLQNLPWSDWEFVKGGAVPQGTSTSQPSSSSGGGSGSASDGTTTVSGTKGSSGSSSNTTSQPSAGSNTTPAKKDDTAAGNQAGSDATSSSKTPAAAALDTTVNQPITTILSSNKSSAEKAKAAAVLSGASMLIVAVGIFGFVSFRRATKHLPAFKA